MSQDQVLCIFLKQMLRSAYSTVQALGRVLLNTYSTFVRHFLTFHFGPEKVLAVRVWKMLQGIGE